MGHFKGTKEFSLSAALLQFPHFCGEGAVKGSFVVSLSPCDDQMAPGSTRLTSHLLQVQWKVRAPFPQSWVVWALIGPLWVT